MRIKVFSIHKYYNFFILVLLKWFYNVNQLVLCSEMWFYIYALISRSKFREKLCDQEEMLHVTDDSSQNSRIKVRNQCTGEEVCYITGKHETEDRKQERETESATKGPDVFHITPPPHVFILHGDLWPLPNPLQTCTHTHTGIPFPCVKLTTHFCTDYKTCTQYLICWHTLHHSTHTPDSSRIWALCVCMCVCVWSS